MTTAPDLRDDRAAVDKAISLLTAFGDRGSSGVGVSELARRAQLSKSTAFRLLGTLERNGVVERVGTDYRLGERLHQLGRSVYAPDHEHVHDLLLPHLTDLYELTRHTSHLAVLHGTDVVYLAKLYGHRPAPVPSRVGGRLPAHATAVGKVMLAYDAEAAARATVTPLHRFTTRTITDPTALCAELDRVRRTGIAYDDEESRPGLSCVAAPVLDRAGRLVAALSIAGRRGHIDTVRLGADVRRIAAAASRTWAGHGRTAARA
ncbi:IclR family transcriptional regulator [Streptomyces acidiscabies]|uniref:IclR family transcriptional regulator n=1 Tax=Streptomyces acidiscabies TaxID=42234 RepID=A0AAP6BHJ1_9ACTN|nr:IclR family transcriptional regulator [Streptomyces acidiscabies]MBP5934902.1 IclR family transcriptional regulator [Streptomyces sp. LBUM 1476]MBZ3917333.1 IclR family transcriptional regulator [Streptomyces acidiscabies]MDX2964858.1 IclR family transcriptional regulator [Streptomyces acidiscabies]MDX3023359.1 IclR family transcriptional regulator [Streptomyces acidiscabies]MDX3796533.1 IclR family transcriptional regulator [Streptomyces acidiscabies]